MAGKQQGVAVVVSEAAGQSAARRLWRAVLYVLRRGMPAATDLNLLLHRGKIAGKALGDLLILAFRHGRHHSYAAAAGGSSFSCGALGPGLAVREPTRRRREVEFSCSNTPSSAYGGGFHLLGAAKRRRRSSSGQHRVADAARNSSGYLLYSSYDAADVARVFEMLSYDDGDRCLFNDKDDEPAPAPASAARSPAWPFARSSPRAPPSSKDYAVDDEAQVDRQADEFIRRFYEQLRAQRSAASTPDYHHGYAAVSTSPYTTTTNSRRAPWPVAAGIA